jgi:hypothetical protein
MIPILLTALLTAAPPNVEIQTLNGQTIAGPIAAISAERIAVDGPNGQVEFKTDELAGLQTKAPAAAGPAAGVWVELVDGSSLAGQSFPARGDRAQLRLGSQALDLSRKDLAAVRFQRPTDALAAEWTRVLEAKIAGDLLLIRKNDTFDYHKGVIGDVTDNEVQFELDGDRLPVKRAKLAGLVYYQPPGRSLPDGLCRITDVDGSQWTAHTVALAEKLLWTTPAGVRMSRPLPEVRRIDFASDKVIYLSDLQPDSSDWKPFFPLEKELPSLAQFYGPRSDCNLRGAKLQLGGRQYAKGLAIHTRTTLVYRLPDRFRRLKATAGIDDQFRPNGVVRLVIRGDERVLVEATVTGKDSPQAIDVDLTGVRRLTIVADCGEGLDVGNHLLLCEARVIK